MSRNPETAYLVSDQAFDKEIDELGILPKTLLLWEACMWKEECIR